MMFTYRNPEKNFLIFAPFLCGSSWIWANVKQLNLTNISEDDGDLRKDLVLAYFKHTPTKFLLFRDPFQRLISYFLKFSYGRVYETNNFMNNHELSMDFWKKFEDWLPNIIDNQWDLHMQPITGQLRDYDLLQYGNQFTVIPNRNYVAWVNQYLDSEMKYYSQNTASLIQVNSYLIPQILTIREQIREIYHEDYEFLRKATFEWRTVYTASNLKYIEEDRIPITSDEENFYEDFSPPEDEIPIYEPEDLPAQHREEIDAPVDVEIETPAPTPVVKPVKRTTNTNRRRRRNR